MIKRIEDPNELYSFNITDIFSIRIKSLLCAYGTQYDFASFYYQKDDNGNITAIMSSLDGDYTLSHSKGFDNTELAAFLKSVGYASVLSDDFFELERPYTQGDIMISKTKKEIHLSYAELDNYPRLMDIFNLEDYDKKDFEYWYVDASHRIRHNCARAAALKVNGEIVSSAMFSSIYEDNAVLTAVNTLPEYRRLGYGSALVSEMICDIKGDVYLMREEGKNEAFYKRLGFVNTGIWRMYK